MGGSGLEDSVIWTPRSEIQHALESRLPRKAVRDFFVQTPSRSRRRHRNAQIVFDDSGVSLGSPTEGCRANSAHIRPSTSWQNAIILGGKTFGLITTLLARDFCTTGRRRSLSTSKRLHVPSMTRTAPKRAYTTHTEE